MKSLFIGEILPEEYPLMEEIMYESVHQPDLANPYPKDMIYLPQVRIYWDNWGEEKDDYCVIAKVDDKFAGAVWVRVFRGEIKGFGYIDENTPELAIALFKEYRNMGVGTLLMRKMINLLKRKSFCQVSLSITKGNPAIRLYERLGFEIVNENEDDYTMLLKLV